MKILVTGADGQLGREIARQGQRFGVQAIPATRADMDITERRQIKRGLEEYRPALLINAAAYTNVDAAESEKRLAFAVNAEGPGNLAECCGTAGIPLIHISTDFVFDGKQTRPYHEEDPISPLGIYGESKAAGEKAVRHRSKAHLIIRTAWLYSADGHNFVKTILRLGKEREMIRVVADQHGCPTRAVDLAEALLTLGTRIRDGLPIPWGTYHYCGEGITSWHGFAEKIGQLAGQVEGTRIPRVVPVTTAEYPTVAHRPAFSALDCSLIQKNFGIRPKPWQESLKAAIVRVAEL